MRKNMRYAHFYEICEKCGNKRYMRQSHKTDVSIRCRGDVIELCYTHRGTKNGTELFFLSVTFSDLPILTLDLDMNGTHDDRNFTHLT